jgi:hypothetical protein
MVRHLAVGVNDKVETGADEAQNLQPYITVGNVAVDGAELIATRSDMVKRAGKFDSKWSVHQKTLASANVSGLMERRIWWSR